MLFSPSADGVTRDRAARDAVGVAPWLGIQVRHLAALEAVAEEGSFNKAAKKLGYTQSAISQQVAALERIVGERLVVRPERFQRVTPTPAGEIMLEQARGILARLRVAQGEVHALREGNAGVVRVGIFQGLGSLVSGALVRRFPIDDPGVQLQMIHTISDAELLEPLGRGEIDLAFVTLPLEPGPLVVEELLAEELQLVLPPNDPLGRSGKLTPNDLHGLRLVCLRRCRSTDQALARLEANGIKPDVVYRTDDSGTLLGLVRAGATAALLPELLVESDAHGLVARSLSTPQLYRRIGIAWRREQPPADAAAEFVAIVRDVLAARDRRIARAS
jgi:DNA-binding transcriptional LysR family regulator